MTTRPQVWITSLRWTILSFIVTFALLFAHLGTALLSGYAAGEWKIVHVLWDLKPERWIELGGTPGERRR
jgi:hypothetical protein